MRAIVALALKDIRLLMRDRAGFFFVLVFPVVYAVFFGSIFRGMVGGGSASKIDVAVVDLDSSLASTKLVLALQENPGLVIRSEEAADSGRELVRLRKVDACLIIPRGYGAEMATPFWGDAAVLELAVDPSRGAESGMLQGLVMQEAYARMQDVFTKPALMRQSMKDALASLDGASPEEQARLAPLRHFIGSVDTFFASELMDAEQDGTANPDNPIAGGFQPVKVEVKSIAREQGGRPTTPWDITFPQSMMWALMSCSFGFALSLVVERRTGTLTRLQAAPTRRWQVLAGKALACLIVNLGVLTLLMGVGFALGVRPGSMAGLVAALVCSAIAFVGIMMLLSVCGKTEASVNGIGWAVMMLMAMVGGAMVPRFVMPEWMQSLGVISPIGWGIQALEGAIWRDYTISQMALPCGVLLGIGLTGFALGAKVFDWKGGE